MQETGFLGAESMSSSEYPPAPRRRRRSHRVLRAFKLAAPFLLLIAVGLLSAGVIQIVEKTAAPRIKHPLEQAPASSGQVDPRQGWQGSTHLRGSGGVLQLGEIANVPLDGVLPTSFLQLESTSSDLEERQVERGFGGPGAGLLPTVEYPAEVKPVPEPDSALLLAIGLGLLGIRRQSFFESR